MKVFIFAFGKLKNPGLRDAANYYQKILGSWVDLQEIELKPIPVPDKSEATRKSIQEKESQLLLERIAKHTGGRGLVIPLSENGKAQPTRAWAEMAGNWENTSVPAVCFCIGSSLGFSKAFLSQSHSVLSFGPHTLSHELARVVLYEQIYRTWSVIRGHPYHNE